MDEKLLPLQKKILALYKEKEGELPSFRELAKLIGVSSTNTISYHIKKLKEKGYLGIDKAQNAIVEINIKTLSVLFGKSGVYVLLENKVPFLVSSAENIFENIIDEIKNKKGVLERIKNSSAKIMIAYYLIDDRSEREDLKKHLIDFYKNQKINLL